MIIAHQHLHNLRRKCHDFGIASAPTRGCRQRLAARNATRRMPATELSKMQASLKGPLPLNATGTPASHWARPTEDLPAASEFWSRTPVFCRLRTEFWCRTEDLPTAVFRPLPGWEETRMSNHHHKLNARPTDLAPLVTKPIARPLAGGASTIGDRTEAQE